MSLAEKLDKIRSPKLQNQRETAIVLSAVEETLKDQQYGSTPTAYFAALLALLSQSVSPSNGIVNKELATSVVYLIDIVIPFVPVPLLRSKFSQILPSITPLLNNHEIEAPLIRSSIGCLESLLVAQDATAWALLPTQVGPRRAVAGLLALAADHRPKVRKRAQDAITIVLKAPPPSPSLDHPAADMCAETAMRSLADPVAASATKKRKSKAETYEEQHQPGLIHALQVVKTVASASGGWPSKKIEPLCELLMNISSSSNEYLTMAAFEIFELMFEGMADSVSSSKLPRLMKAITDLRPSQDDSQLLPPWIAVLSRGYDVSAQIIPEETLQKLPQIFEMVSTFLTSQSYNIRVSASECLVSFLINCIPRSVIVQPSESDEAVLETIAQMTTVLLSVKYQAARTEVFNVISTFFDVLRWRSINMSNDIIRLVGELRSNDAFNGKKEADALLGKAVEAVGPAAVLSILPLNLANSSAKQRGRAWLLPVLRNHVANTNLAHFKSEFVPLSELLFQRLIESGPQEKTMLNKILETLIEQIWALLPGYSNSPTDLVSAFDQGFAELLANLLYKQTELRVNICAALRALVETNQAFLSAEVSPQARPLQKLTKEEAQRNLDHLASFAANLLAVLFNIYSETLPHYRGFILQCINAYLSITPEKELLETFERVATALETALDGTTSQTQLETQQQKQQPKTDKMPPTTHTLMDLMITLSIYLPRSVFPTLFALAAKILPQAADPQLQKKAYKLFPRITASSTGVLALHDRNLELQALLLNSASTASSPCRRDRLDAIAVVVEYLSPTSLQFIPSILSEVVISAKEVNEKARAAAFDLLVLMGRKMQAGGTVAQNQIPHMPSDAPNVDASLEEFFTMVSAGLVGSTPHMVSASITALTRILYEFHAQLSTATMEDLVLTMDLFLTSANREIVRSVLGFTKVATISLPESIVKPRLEGLVRGLMSWSREHKAHFRAKVKHIFERMIRRFGFDLVERHCPEDDKKFIVNIRKTKERRKRKKEAGDEDEAEDGSTPARKKNKFESEYENALYGSDESTDEDDGEDGTRKGHTRAGGAGVFIVEDSDEPLDLLDRKALGHISTTRPVSSKASTKSQKHNQTNHDGKLVFGESSADDDDNDDDDAMVLDANPRRAENHGEISLEAGINAYVDAIRGRHAVRRGRGGKLKFSNKRSTGRQEEQEEVAEAEAEDPTNLKGGKNRNQLHSSTLNSGRARGRGQGDTKYPKSGSGRAEKQHNSTTANTNRNRSNGNGSSRGRARGEAPMGNGNGNGSGSGSGRGSGSGVKRQQAQRRGLGAVREGRVGKSRR